MNDIETKRFIVRALQLAAEAWDQLARDAWMPEFEVEAAKARALASTLQTEIDTEAPANNGSVAP